MTWLLGSLAPWLANPLVILAVVASLTIWAAVFAIRLSKHVARVRDALAAADRRLSGAGDVAIRLQAENAELEADPVLGAGWRSFHEGLFFTNSPKPSAYSTVSARACFPLASLLRRVGCDTRYHAALPGFLVGAGLLFTFLGLAAALSSASDVVRDGATQAQRSSALHGLLGAASAKFISSLIGLLLSIIYAIYRSHQLHGAERALDHFVVLLQRSAPFRSPAVLQVETNQHLRDQLTEIQRVENEFWVNLGNKLNEPLNNSLAQHISPLQDALDRLAAGLSQQNGDAVQQMLSVFLQKLEGQVGGSMSATTSTLDRLAAQLDGVGGGIEHSARRMAEAATEMTTSMRSGAEDTIRQIATQVGDLVSTLRETAVEARRAGGEAGQDFARQIQLASGTLVQSIAQLQERVASAGAEGVRAAAGAIAVGAEQAASTFREGAQAVVDELGRAGARIEQACGELAGVVSRIGEASATLAREATALGDAARETAQPLVRAAADLREAGEAARDAATPMRSSADGLTHGSRAIDAASQALGETRRAAQELTAKLGEAAARFEGLDQALEAVLLRLGDSLAHYGQVVDQHVRDIDAGLAKSVDNLRAVAQDLGGHVEELADALADAQPAARRATAR